MGTAARDESNYSDNLKSVRILRYVSGVGFTNFFPISSTPEDNLVTANTFYLRLLEPLRVLIGNSYSALSSVH
jgi:hypothetical protein